jgi:hypothetical protein
MLWYGLNHVIMSWTESCYSMNWAMPPTMPLVRLCFYCGLSRAFELWYGLGCRGLGCRVVDWVVVDWVVVDWVVVDWVVVDWVVVDWVVVDWIMSLCHRQSYVYLIVHYESSYAWWWSDMRQTHFISFPYRFIMHPTTWKSLISYINFYSL